MLFHRVAFTLSGMKEVRKFIRNFVDHSSLLDFDPL